MSNPTDVQPQKLREGARVLSTKNVAFISIMGALGNVLSWLSISLTPFLPKIPLGPMSISIAFDLSHLTTFIAALYGGPSVGGLTGLIGGVVAANIFGFSQGNLLTGFALPVGKALTGITAGFVMQALGLRSGKRHQAFTVASTPIAYLPEGVFTVFIFLVVLPIVMQVPAGQVDAFRSFIFSVVTAPILVKAFLEMLVEGIILTALSVNQSFRNFMNGFFKPS